jgi:hypothetical protein
MTTSATAELRFACPHCGQRIACDPAYAGHPMLCPACHQSLQIPLPDSAFGTVANASQAQPLTVTALDTAVPADQSGDESAPDDAARPEGFFTLGRQMRYAAIYAAVVFYVGLLAGWEPARQWANPDRVRAVAGVGEDFDRLNRHEKLGRVDVLLFGGRTRDSGGGYGGPGIYYKVTFNEVTWLLLTGAICSGYGMVKGGHALPVSADPRKRLTLALAELAERNPRFGFIFHWFRWALLIFVCLLVVCPLVPQWLAWTLDAFGAG